MGRPYSIEQLQQLIASLTSSETKKEIKAIEEYAKNSDKIDAKLDETPKVSKEEFMDIILSAVLRNQQKMLLKFEKQRKMKVLHFLSSSIYMPKKIRRNARAILNNLHAQSAQKKLESPVAPYSKEQTAALVRKLDSPAKEKKVAAAIEFIRHYPRIVPAVSKTPMLTVTSVTKKACAIVQDNKDAVFGQMRQRKMIPELMFVASLAQIPLPLRKQAEAIVRDLKGGQTAGGMVSPHPAMAKTAKLDKILAGLKSKDPKKTVPAALGFLKNYDEMAAAISVKPEVTVTEVHARVMEVVDQNLPAVLSKLAKENDRKTVSFLSSSAKVPEAIRKVAKDLLAKMQKPPGRFAGFKDKA